MNRRIVLLLVGSLPTGLTLASAPSLAAQERLVLQPSELCSDHPDTAIAAFEDGNLESRVRAALAVGEQNDLRCGLLQGLTELVGTERADIESLAGIQNLTSLTRLLLGGNSISDLSALIGLTSLTELGLPGSLISDISALSRLTSLTDLRLHNNPITDISPLRGLTNLTGLFLGSNSISDISALTGLTSLRTLLLGGNSISDISALSGLTNLTRLNLVSNSITDVSALRGLTTLRTLVLESNPNLSNILPLLDNTGLGEGDNVSLKNTRVSCTDVAALQAKGVTVESDCS